MEAVMVVAVATLHEDAAVAETFRKHLAADVVQVNSCSHTQLSSKVRLEEDRRRWLHYTPANAVGKCDGSVGEQDRNVGNNYVTIKLSRATVSKATITQFFVHPCNSFAMLRRIRNCCGIIIIINYYDFGPFQASYQHACMSIVAAE